MPAIDTAPSLAGSNADPADFIAAVTPNDSADLAYISRGIFAGVAGNIKVTTKGGSVETFPIVAGMPLPLRVTRVWATGTTATGIFVIW